MTANVHSDHRRLLTLLRGFEISRALRLVADLGVADRIDPDVPRRTSGLADECGVDPAQLIRVLRGLASVEVFRLGDDEMVAHSPMSVLLRTDTPRSLHHAARFWTERTSWRAWEHLDAALHGEVPHERAWGVGRFEHLRRDEGAARIFDESMAHFTDGRHQAIADSYDFGPIRTVVDVGGGNGEALRRILDRFEHLLGIVYDRADVVGAIGDGDRMGGRIATVAGDFFDRAPGGGDLYLLVCVLHDWGDDDCTRILRSCRAASQPGTRLLVCERVLEPDPLRGDPMDYLVDLQMMAMYGSGRERTEREFRRLLAAGGYSLERIHGTSSQISILEATAT